MWRWAMSLQHLTTVHAMMKAPRPPKVTTKTKNSAKAKRTERATVKKTEKVKLAQKPPTQAHLVQMPTEHSRNPRLGQVAECPQSHREDAG
jgi:hypothetical protein